MLQQMRQLSKSWLSSVFLGLLALSFGVWGIADIFKGNADTSVATVGSTTIDYQVFSRDFDNIRRNAATQAGAQLSQAKLNAIGQQTLQHEISDTALDNVTRSLGLLTTDEEVSSAIRQIPQFRGPLGGFDQTTFEQALGRINFTPQGFVDEMRRELTRNQLVAAASAGVALPQNYVRAFFAYLNEVRAVQYVVLPPDAAGAIPTPPDAVLAAYVKAHPAAFSTPEYREVTYATIGPDDVAKQVQVTDAQLHQTYDMRKDIYVIPEQRDIQRINFPTEAAAKAARAKIDAGAKFEDIAKSRGMSDTDLNLGSLKETDLANQGPAAFALPLNGVSQPVKFTFGWSLLRVTKITAGSTRTFDDVKADLKAELTKRLAASKLEDIRNAFEDARDAGDDLAEAAKKVGMTVLHVPACDAQGLAPNGTKADVPAAKDFLDQVFKSDVGTEGDPFSASDGHLYVLKVDGIVPQKLKPLDQVRAQALAAWSAEQRLDRLGALAATLAKQADETGTLVAIAARYRVPAQSSGLLQRDTPTAVFNQALNAKIFASPPGHTVFGPAPAGGGYVLARITGVAHPPLPLADPRYQQFAGLLGNQVSEDLEQAMATAARAQQGVKINQQQVDRILGGEGS